MACGAGHYSGEANGAPRKQSKVVSNRGRIRKVEEKGGEGGGRARDDGWWWRGRSPVTGQMEVRGGDVVHILGERESAGRNMLTMAIL